MNTLQHCNHETFFPFHFSFLTHVSPLLFFNPPQVSPFSPFFVFFFLKKKKTFSPFYSCIFIHCYLCPYTFLSFNQTLMHCYHKNTYFLSFLETLGPPNIRTNVFSLLPLSVPVLFCIVFCSPAHFFSILLFSKTVEPFTRWNTVAHHDSVIFFSQHRLVQLH